MTTPRGHTSGNGGESPSLLEYLHVLSRRKTVFIATCLLVPIVAVLLSLASSAPVVAATFVYVSNAEDGDIGMYTLQADGSLQPGQRFKAEKLVMPMAVSPDKRLLVAAVRSKPFQAYSYTIDKNSGALGLVGTGTLAESYPYIAFDRGGRW